MEKDVKEIRVMTLYVRSDGTLRVEENMMFKDDEGQEMVKDMLKSIIYGKPDLIEEPEKGEIA